MKIAPTIQRITTRGQVTVPSTIRSEFDTGYVSMTPMNGGVFVAPVHINTGIPSTNRKWVAIKNGTVGESKKTEIWTSVWNAKRDNNGKSMPIQEFSDILDKVRIERGL